MHASLVPTANDLASLVAYVLGNPYLFISSSTVMTTGLVLGAVAVSMVPRTGPVMRTVAPPLAMVLLYFGVGSLVLATEILVRFRRDGDAIRLRGRPPARGGCRHRCPHASPAVPFAPDLDPRQRGGGRLLVSSGPRAHAAVVRVSGPVRRDPRGRTRHARGRRPDQCGFVACRSTAAMSASISKGLAR